MKCVICMFLHTDGGEVGVAVTVLRGMALCDEHVTYVDGGPEFAEALDLAVRNERGPQ